MGWWGPGSDPAVSLAVVKSALRCLVCCRRALDGEIAEFGVGSGVAGGFLAFGTDLLWVFCVCLVAFIGFGGVWR